MKAGSAAPHFQWQQELDANSRLACEKSRLQLTEKKNTPETRKEKSLTSSLPIVHERWRSHDGVAEWYCAFRIALFAETKVHKGRTQVTPAGAISWRLFPAYT